MHSALYLVTYHDLSHLCPDKWLHVICRKTSTEPWKHLKTVWFYKTGICTFEVHSAQQGSYFLNLPWGSSLPHIIASLWFCKNWFWNPILRRGNFWKKFYATLILAEIDRCFEGLNVFSCSSIISFFLNFHLPWTWVVHFSALDDLCKKLLSSSQFGGKIF